MDYFTKWPEVFATEDQTAETIAHLLVEHVIARHGVPEQLLSDRGLSATLLQEVLKLVGMVKINTSGYHAGGKVQWNTHQYAGTGRSVCVYRVAVQESTQASPFYLLYGRKPRTPTESALSQPRTPYQIDFPDYCSEMVAHLSDAWSLEAQGKQKTQYDKKATQDG